MHVYEESYHAPPAGTAGRVRAAVYTAIVVAVTSLAVAVFCNSPQGHAAAAAAPAADTDYYVEDASLPPAVDAKPLSD